MLGDGSAQARDDEPECAHVRRFFLHPDDLAGMGVALHQLRNLGFRKRIELIDKDDGRLFIVAALALVYQFVAYFATA